MPQETTGVLVFNVLLYIALPMWVVFGFLDYLCHRAIRIEKTTGIREALLHAAMGTQVGIAIFTGLFLEINVLSLLIMVVVLVLHEVVAHYDVKLACKLRDMSI